MSADILERALAAAPPGSADRAMESGLMTWLADDPAAAARFAELQTGPFLREVALRTVAQRWALLDPDAAARWADSLADAAERDRALEGVALTIAGTDARAALDLLARRGTGKLPDTAQVGVVASWASRDFAAARSWVEAQPPGPTRDEIVQHLAFLRAQHDPAAAAELADRLISDEAARRDAWAAVAQAWAAKDPDGMRNWDASADAGTRRRIDAELALARHDPASD